MSSSLQNQQSSDKEEQPLPMEDDCFIVIRNYRKMQQLPSNSERDMSIIVIKDSYSPPNEEEEDVSEPPLVERKRKRLRKDKKSKNYSTYSQNKRQIAVRYKEPSERGSETTGKLIQLWTQLWKSQIQQFRNNQDVEALKIFQGFVQQPLQVFLPELQQEMPVPQPQPQSTKIKVNVPEHPQVPEHSREEEQLFLNIFFNYENSMYNHAQESQSFFFEKRDDNIE